METSSSWDSVLRPLKEAVYAFNQQVLLQPADKSEGLLAGRLASAHEGNILEAINMALNSFDNHYIDRDLRREWS
jgi:hypothetical protein